MAKIIKFSGYLIDFEDRYEDWILDEIVGGKFDGIVHNVTHKTADIGEWHDDHPLNRCDCGVEECEMYFKEINNV